MPTCEQLLELARSNPRGVRFVELCSLAECHGWQLARQSGSHHIYKRKGQMRLMDFQPGANGMAKPYQVRQLLRDIDAANGRED